MEFRNLKLDEYHLVRALHESYYGENVYSVEKKYFHWLHFDNPLKSQCAADDEFTAYGAIENGKLLACINYLPTQVFVQGESFLSSFSVESIARDGSGGVYGLLLRRLAAKFHYYFSMGATQFLRTVYESQGFQYCDNIGRVIIVGSPDQLTNLLKGNSRGRIDDFSKIGAWGQVTQLSAENGYYEVIRRDLLNDKYWQSYLETKRAIVLKNPDYLRWRYFDHPYANYEIISTDRQQSGGIAVLRREKIRNRQETVIRLLEFLPVTDCVRQLTQAVCKFLIDSQALFADFFCGSDHFLQGLPRPFVQLKEHLPYDVPYLFQPLEWRDRYSINTALGINKRLYDHLHAIRLEDVYFTKGDGGQDVILNPEYHTRGF